MIPLPNPRFIPISDAHYPHHTFPLHCSLSIPHCPLNIAHCPFHIAFGGRKHDEADDGRFYLTLGPRDAGAAAPVQAVIEPEDRLSVFCFVSCRFRLFTCVYLIIESSASLAHLLYRVVSCRAVPHLAVRCYAVFTACLLHIHTVSRTVRFRNPCCILAFDTWMYRSPLCLLFVTRSVSLTTR